MVTTTFHPRTILHIKSARTFGLPAAAADDRHVHVILEHNLLVLVQVQHGDGREVRGHAARLGHSLGVHGVDERLHDGVVRSVHVRRQGEGAVAVAEPRVVARRRHYPVVPADVVEVDVERVATARGPRLLTLAVLATERSVAGLAEAAPAPAA